MLPHLKPHYHILDFGCGPGTITTGLAKYVPQGSVTGIDLAPEVIAQAESFASQREGGVPANVTFAVGNALERLPFEDERFDVVFMSQVLLHIPHPVKALQELRRVVKTGGLIADREGDWPFRWYPELPGLELQQKYLYSMVITRQPPDASHGCYPPFGPEHRGGSRVHVWAREAGFEASKIEKSARVTVHSTAEEREQWAGTTVARIEQGGHRQKYKEVGATDEEIDSIVRDVARWREDVDGMHWIVQFEVLAWK